MVSGTNKDSQKSVWVSNSSCVLYGLCREQVGLKSELVLVRTLKRADSSEMLSEYT
jgi:hypothetical protein